MPIYAIMEGKVTPYILDKNFERYLPVIPSEVSAFNCCIQHIHFNTTALLY